MLINSVTWIKNSKARLNIVNNMHNSYVTITIIVQK